MKAGQRQPASEGMGGGCWTVNTTRRTKKSSCSRGKYQDQFNLASYSLPELDSMVSFGGQLQTRSTSQNQTMIGEERGDKEATVQWGLQT